MFDSRLRLYVPVVSSVATRRVARAKFRVLTVHERAIEWITDRHAHAHQKGTGSLSAGGCQVEIERVAQPVKDREAGE
jgi:hypothetical protein